MSKKKILLLSDDLRMSSGIGTMSKEFVLGTLHHYDWVQLGGSIKHPEEGKIVDMNESVRKETGIEDAYLKIYCASGYGNQEVVRELMHVENPDAILHYTDPRFWIWLYQMENEIRHKVPLFYYNIWDDLPYPNWNANFYDSCDLLMNISRQTVNLVKNVLHNEGREKEDWQITYLPHGVAKDYQPLTELDVDKWNGLEQFRKHILQDKEKDFVLFWNSRNIRRKMPGDIILAFKMFCDMLPKEQADKCALLMHSQPIDDNGTDLPEVVRNICPDYDVMFSADKLDNTHMNYLYNIADVTIMMSSNEGFGLATCESLRAGTPIIVNVTGGLQDQCRFEDENGDWIKFTTDFPSNHTGRYKKCGEWAKPVFPTSRALMGSPPTPYIFDDRCNFEDAADRIKEWYDVGNEERERCGEVGAEWIEGDESMMTGKHMSENFIKDMETAFEKWKKPKPFQIYNTERKVVKKNPGILEGKRSYLWQDR